MKISSVESLLLILTTVVMQIQDSLAQKADKTTVTTTIQQIGKNSVNQQPITATEYIFPERIQDFKVDTINKYFTLELRGLSKNGKWLDNRGDVVRYSTRENRVLWSKKVSFQYENIEQYGGITLHTAGGKAYCLNNESGEQMWQVQNSLLYVDSRLNTAIGYKFKVLKGQDDIAEGINLKDGSILWQRHISREYGWNDSYRLDDSILLVVSDGLHTLNLRNGKGWDYAAKTGKKDYKVSAVGTGMGIAAGLLTGMYSVPTGHYLVGNVCSNVLIDSLHICFASKQELVQLDKNGKVIWKAGLTEEETSKSWIFKQGADLIMINSGYAKMGQQKVYTGKPFMASYNANTGQLNFKTIISNDKESIQDYRIVNDEVILVFNRRAEKYSIKDGKLLASTNYDITETGELSYFIGADVFVKQGDGYLSLTASNPQKLYIYTKNGKALVCDQSLKLTDKISLNDFYIAYLRTKGLTFIGKQKESVIVDEAGKEQAQFNGTINAVLLNNKLYTTRENSFLKIDLTELLGKSES